MAARVGKNSPTRARVRALLAIAERNGISQAELARQIGRTNRSIISEWKAGRAEPDLEDFRRLCETLRVSADRVLGLGEVEVPPPVSRESLDEAVQHLSAALYLLGVSDPILPALARLAESDQASRARRRRKAS